MGGPCFVERKTEEGKVELDVGPDCTDNFQIVCPPFEFDGECWDSVEQCYQAMRFEKGSARRVLIHDTKPDWSHPLVQRARPKEQAKVVSANHGFECWGLSKGASEMQGYRTDFNDVKEGVMLRVNCAKYASSNALQQELLATAGMTLIGASTTGDWKKWNLMIQLFIRQKLLRGQDLEEILAMSDTEALRMLKDFASQQD
eukprot:TRINITY_DN6949_c0_g1_i1.p1 TRINITY_DN6949_c0_g1~~TRINITY_DN6949_c0_g1_i1.p1  ORF type:complete len:201 (+),score=42.65 TRINITY_DN6949_c0_g1_i1:184-786(+)